MKLKTTNKITIYARAPPELTDAIRDLVNLRNYKEGKMWTKSDMVRLLLQRGATKVSKENGWGPK